MADTRCKYGQQRNAAELDKKQAERSSRTVHNKSGSERQSDNVAHAKHDGLIAAKKREGIKETVRKKQKGQKGTLNIERAGSLSKTREDVADSDSERQQEQWWAESTQENYDSIKCKSWWSVEPSVGRVAHGIPNRVDRLKGLGNAVVPQIPAVLGRAILEVHNG